MAKPYKVLVKAKGGWQVYASCKTRAEAELVLENINMKNLSKVYKRYSKRGFRQPGHEVIAGVYAKTAIQY